MHVLVRFAHFSDIHVTTQACAWRAGDWVSKRMAAWVNLRLLGRGFRFRQAENVLAALLDDLKARRPDHILFSGDATAMGFEEEVARAARLLHVEDWPGLAVPGNHDYCTRAAMVGGHFERHFAPWQAGERIDGHIYPFAQVGHAWVIGVSSATANRWAWDARGLVGSAQMGRLGQLLARLEGGPRILVTHYPVGLASGKYERRARGLRDLKALLHTAHQGGVGLWLHGHRHAPYHLAEDRLAPFPAICAGSATQTGLWSYWEYALTDHRLSARQRVYQEKEKAFADGETLTLDLPGAVAAGA